MGKTRGEMNANVRLALAYSPSLTICTSLASGAPLAAYILLRTGSNSRVGLATGAQGVANMLAAWPAAWLGDRFGRRYVIAGACACGAAGMALLCAAVVALNDGDADRQFVLLCGATATFGLFVGGSSASIEAIFGDSVATGQRSLLYTRRSSLRVAGNAAGPLVSILIFWRLGNHWRTSELEYVIAAGAAFFLVPAALALSLDENKTLGRASEAFLTIAAAQDAVVTARDAPRTAPSRCHEHTHEEQQEARDELCDDHRDDDPQQQGLLEEEASARSQARRRRRIAATIVCADVVSMLGSGMTVKFFPIFFWKDCGLSPIQVNCIYAAGPLGVSAAAFAAQRLSSRLGRVETAVLTKFCGIALLVWMSVARDDRLVVALYLARTWLMNCCQGITRSVLNDYVPKAERARWNAFESINLFSWSGSAVLGGFLIEKKGFRATFAYTAALQFCSVCALASIAGLVRAETHTDDTAAERAAERSENGFSLVQGDDVDETQPYRAPAHADSHDHHRDDHDPRAQTDHTADQSPDTIIRAD